MFKQAYLRIPQRSRRPPSRVSARALPQSSTQEEDREIRKKVHLSDSLPQSKAERLRRNAQTVWQPFFLSRKTLFAFLLLFSLIIAALETLQVLSDKNYGIASSSSGKHYLWTYGPTAFLVVIVSFWRQVDYQAKQIAPWAQMADGYATADQSVLLDYISPMLIVSLFKSLKNRHFLVVLTISEFILIKILVILSTGLLVLESVPIRPTNITLQTSGKFDGSTFDASYVDSGPALAALAIQSYSMSYPMFSNDRYAVQPVDLPATWSNSNAGVLTTTVEYFGADLDCEEAVFNYPSITSSSCNATIYSLKVPSYSGYVAAMQPAICPTNVELDICKRSGEDDLSIQMMVILAFSNGNRILNATTLLCKPLYELGRAEIIMNRTTAYSEGITIKPIAGTTNQTLKNVPQQDLARGVLVSLLDLINLQTTAFHLRSTDSFGSIDTFFNFILALEPARPVWELMDVQTLTRDVKSVYRSMTAQMARSHLTANANDSVPATFTGTGNRIIIRKLATRLMQGFCAALSLMTALCIVLCPRGVLPRSIDGLAGHIAIFARSTDAMELFIATGQKPISRLEQITGFYKFKTTAESLADRSAFLIKAEISPKTQKKLHGTAAVEVPARRWWRPLPLSMPMMLLTTLAPLVLIAVVESTFQTSNAHRGLGPISDAQERFRYVWTFLPALLLTGVATLFNMLDFEVETILPYQVLRRDASSAESTVFTNLLSKTSVQAIWDGVCHRQLAVIATAISVVFAPLLTIVVSGLFTVEKVPTSQSGVVRQFDWFDNLSNVSYNSEAQNMAELVSLYNMPFPQWTYGGLVLPGIDVSPPKGMLGLEAFTTVEYTTPALRGRMNCSSVLTLTNTTRIRGRGGPNPILPKTLVDFSPTQGDPCFFDNGTAAGHTGSYTPSRGGGYFGEAYFYNHVKRRPCNDTIHLAFGNITGRNLDQLEDVQTLRCLPYVEQVLVNVTLAFPDLTMVKSAPPFVLDHPAKYFSSYSILASGFPLQNVPVADSYDDFTKYMVYGRDAVPLGDLLHNTSRLIESVELTYETYVAQILNSKGVRINAPANRNNSISATFTDGNRQRLIQHGLSTRLLEGVLAVLFLCTLVTYASTWRSTNGTRRILPKSPCSIASVASLLAGSDLLKLVPPGTEFLSNKQMKEQGTFKGYFFNLGWWDETQRFGIDVGKADGKSPPEIPYGIAEQ